MVYFLRKFHERNIKIAGVSKLYYSFNMKYPKMTSQHPDKSLDYVMICLHLPVELKDQRRRGLFTERLGFVL